jgi:hypothetical protein
VTSLLTAAVLAGLGFYALGSISLRRAVRGGAGVIRSNPLERVARVGAIALNAGLNLVLWVWISRVPQLAPAQVLIHGLGGALAGIGLLAAIPNLARRSGIQAVLGWASWLMPMSWPSTALGLFVFVTAWGSAMWTRTIRLRLDLSTGTIETSGLPPLGRFRGGFNLGNFTFLVCTSPTPFSAVGISAHEAGHTLNVAAFGSVWHLLGNGLEQNVPPFARGVRAYGELMAESLRPDPSQSWLGQWS